MRRLIAACAIVLALATTAEARTSPGCPAHLGCGCNLATYFNIADAHLKRALWIAREWLHHFNRAEPGCVGCVAVLSRGRGGHVGVVKGYDANGNPTIYSYANARLGWRTATYPRSRVIGYRYIN